MRLLGAFPPRIGAQAYFESHLRAPKDRAGQWRVESEKPGVAVLASERAKRVGDLTTGYEITLLPG